MPRIPAAARTAYHNEMHAARTSTDTAKRWLHLERAHILSQPGPWLHTGNHMAMFTLAIRHRDRREALGQVLRIVVAAPASLTGRFPEGNTGRARVGLRRPMSTPPDLAALLQPGRRLTTENGRSVIADLVRVRSLPVRGLTVSAIGYGSMGTVVGYGAGDDTESVAAIRRAHDLGVTFFGTA